MKLSVSTVFVIALLIGSLALVSTFHSVVAQSTIPQNGLINADSTWTKANSPYNLTSPVAINQGVTLTIEPGVVVNLGEYYLQVNGTLRAIGSDSDKIQFDGHTLEFFNITRHGYIAFSQSSTSYNSQTGSGCIIENAVLTGDLLLNNASLQLSKDTLGEIDINGGSPVISDSVIQGGMGVYSASPTITGCTISGSSGYFGIGRSQERNYNVMVITGYSSPVIANNHIAEPGRGGILFSNEGMYSNFTAVIFGNTIYSEDMDGIIILGGPGSIVVSNNEIYGLSNPGSGASFYSAGGITVQRGDSSQGEASVTVEHNLIYDKTVGLKLYSSALIQHNTIRDCDTAILASSEATVAYNNIQNYNHSITLTGSSNLNAANNWWGTTDQTAISNTITDNKNNYNLGTVTFTPILTSPDSSAMPDPNAPTPTLNPTPAQTSTPTGQTPTEVPSTSPSQNPTENPNASGSQTILGLDLFQTLIVVLLAAIVVCLVILIAVMHRRKEK